MKSKINNYLNRFFLVVFPPHRMDVLQYHDCVTR